MFLYSLKLAITNLKNRPDLTVLMIFLVSIGLALLTIMTTTAYQSSKVSIPHKSELMHTVLIDSRDMDARNIDEVRRLPSLTYIDAENLLQANNEGVEKTYLWKSFVFLNSESNNATPRQTRLMAGQSNFFSLFDAPFLYGRGWTEEDDRSANQVIVLSYQMNQHFFGGENSVGKSININSTPMVVIGVMAHWDIPSRFYDRSFSGGRFDDVFAPSTTMIEMNIQRRISCWDKDRALRNAFSQTDMNGLKNSECTWITMWAYIKDKNDLKSFSNYIDQYVDEQKSLGRFPRPAQNVLLNINQYTDQIFSGLNGNFILQFLSWLFYTVCLVNTIGILLAKYMGKIPEIALRRALGAKKKVILMQYMIEIAFISFIGGLFGLVFSHYGLVGMMHITIYQSDYTVTAEAIRHGYQLDWVMILQAMLIGVGSTLLVSLYPVLKICNTPPANQLKVQ